MVFVDPVDNRELVGEVREVREVVFKRYLAHEGEVTGEAEFAHCSRWP